MTSENAFEYARDDFNYPQFLQRLVQKVLNAAIRKAQESNINEAGLRNIRYGMLAVSIVSMLFHLYLISAFFIAIYLFLDQINLHLFVDRALPASRLKHFIDEVPLVLGLAIHMWLEGNIWTGFAAIVGISGLYLLTNLQMKYDLMSIHIPRLYFLRWDRMGIVFLFTLLGAWPGERAYLFVVLLAWFLVALSYYDYIWIVIQLAKKKK